MYQTSVFATFSPFYPCQGHITQGLATLGNAALVVDLLNNWVHGFDPLDKVAVILV